MVNLIEFKSVTKAFGRTRALDGLSLSVEHGSVYGLIGRNGAGKTTALKMVTGMEAPNRGEVLVFGTQPARLDDVAKAQIAYAGDSQVLPPHMKVSEVSTFVRRATPGWNNGLFREILAEGRIPPGERVRALSKGMKQRLRLALAYARNPRVLVLDEPAEGLDTVVRFGLFSRVLDVVSQGDACAIVSSHVLGDVERIADKIGFISRGKLLVEGGLDDIKDKVRRVRLAWAAGSKPDSRLEQQASEAGAFSFRQEGRQASFVTGRFEAGWRARLRKSHPGCMIEADPLSLEEIFVELLKDEA